MERAATPKRVDLFASIPPKGSPGASSLTAPLSMDGTSPAPGDRPSPIAFGIAAATPGPAPSAAPFVRPLDPPPPPPKASAPPGGPRPSPKREEARSGGGGNGPKSEAIKETPQTAPPPPQKLTEYVSPLVNASRLAYMEAPPEVRGDLDKLLGVSDFWRIERNAWSGTVGVWTKAGTPSAQGNAVLRESPRLEEWTLSLQAKCWQPWEAGRQFFTPEDVAALRVAVPDEIEGLPEVLRRRPRR